MISSTNGPSRSNPAHDGTLEAWQSLRSSAEIVEAVLTFAFEEGALPDDTIVGLCVDPWGTLHDLRRSLARVGGRVSGPIAPDPDIAGSIMQGDETTSADGGQS